MKVINPFITKGYFGPDYFCDRVEEAKLLKKLLANGNNVALISPRRMGKTGLLMHCFNEEQFRDDYYTFIIDIYATKSLREFVYELGREIVNVLKPKGKKVFDAFLSFISSIRAGISYDSMGNPSWNVELGDIHSPSVTLDEIFGYLNGADKRCIVAIDEFQVVANYPENNTEAVLRTYIQHSPQVNFVFAGSQRTMMGEIFISPSRPFYQSVFMMNIGSISLEHYTAFILRHFEDAQKEISLEVIRIVYEMFEGVTWYIQQMMNILYMNTEKGKMCREEDIEEAINLLLNSMDGTFAALLFQLNEKPKQLLVAITKEGKCKGITSSAFVKRHRLTSASSVQSAARVLLEKQLITIENGIYEPYDKLFALWMNRL